MARHRSLPGGPKIGAGLRELRETRFGRRSQAAVARFLGVPPSTLSRIESGERGITSRNQAAFLRLFGAEVSRLLRPAQLQFGWDWSRAEIATAAEVSAYLRKAAERGEDPEVWRNGDFLVVFVGEVTEEEELPVTT